MGLGQPTQTKQSVALCWVPFFRIYRPLSLFFELGIIISYRSVPTLSDLGHPFYLFHKERRFLDRFLSSSFSPLFSSYFNSIYSFSHSVSQSVSHSVIVTPTLFPFLHTSKVHSIQSNEMSALNNDGVKNNLEWLSNLSIDAEPNAVRKSSIICTIGMGLILRVFVARSCSSHTRNRIYLEHCRTFSRLFCFFVHACLCFLFFI